MKRKLPCLVFASLLGLAGCSEEVPDSVFSQPASPILYQVNDSDGNTEAWLFGTIHSLPDGVEWRTKKLEDVVGKADLLVVEIAELEDQRAMTQTFNSLAITRGQPDISRKVPEEYRPALFDMIRRAGLRPSDFGATETWAAALTLAQVGETGQASNGADRALMLEFADSQIHELEGIRKQLGIFDQLPEVEQRELLVEVILDVERRTSDPGKTRFAWLTGDLEELERLGSTGLLADPELRAALLVDRNIDWIEQLLPILDTTQVPLVAVGTAHLVGSDGLPAMLEKKGFKVTRVQ